MQTRNAIIIVLDHSEQSQLVGRRLARAHMTIVMANLFIAGHREDVTFDEIYDSLSHNEERSKRKIINSPKSPIPQ